MTLPRTLQADSNYADEIRDECGEPAISVYGQLHDPKTKESSSAIEGLNLTEPNIMSNKEYPSYCCNCVYETHPNMLTTYCIEAHCDRCKRWARLAIVDTHIGCTCEESGMTFHEPTCALVK